MHPPGEESVMLRDQMFGFLQTAIVFLLLTNAVSALVAFYAMKTANALARPGQQTKTAIERKLEAVLARS
jgi:molybdopterin biosynthesis enzyme